MKLADLHLAVLEAMTKSVAVAVTKLTPNTARPQPLHEKATSRMALNNIQFASLLPTTVERGLMGRGRTDLSGYPLVAPMRAITLSSDPPSFLGEILTPG